MAQTQKKRSKKLIVSIGSLVGLLLVGAAAYWFFVLRAHDEAATTEQQEQPVVAAVCSQELVYRASWINQGGPIDPEQHKAALLEIQKTPGYEQDAGCMYGVVRYYFLVGDRSAAKTQGEKLAAIKDTASLEKIGFTASAVETLLRSVNGTDASSPSGQG